MHIISGNKKLRWSEREMTKVLELLPYWGLTIKDDNVHPAYQGHEVTLYCPYEAMLEKVQNYLKHTGIIITAAAERIADIKVTFVNRQNHNITVHSNALTYHLRPINNTTSATTQGVIHKNVWLPVNDTQCDIRIHSDYYHRSAEWLTYLIIQYVGSKQFTSLRHLPLNLYQQIATAILPPINNDFAELQITKQGADQISWPQLPTKKTNSNQPLNENKEQSHKDDFQNNEITEVELNNEPPQKNTSEEKFKKTLLNEEDKKNRTSPINPFRTQRKSTKNNTFNPFKNRD